jgi:F0F1-type ATP synthase assembly protein I
MLFILIPVLSGVAVGVVVTALASAVNTPTPRSFVVNVLLGASGYIAGIFIGMARAELLPRDAAQISSAAIWTAVLVCLVHELVRWLLLTRRRSQRADR